MVWENWLHVSCRNLRVRGPSAGPEGIVNDHNGSVIDTADVVLEKSMYTSFAQGFGSLPLEGGFA